MQLKSFLENGRTALLLFFLLIVFQTVSGQSKYIRQYKPVADSLSDIYGIPTSVMLGVAIIESGAGKRVGLPGFYIPENSKRTYHSLHSLWCLLFLDVLCIA